MVGRCQHCSRPRKLNANKSCRECIGKAMIGLAKQRLLGLSLLGKTVRFAHLSDPCGKVILVDAQGMVMLDKLGGEFAPHCFVEA
jgi:hypothetical protein